MISAGATFLLALAGAAGGAAMVFVGYRGRRVGTHLHCHRCGFDLFGHPPDSPKCPECGQTIRYGKPRGRQTRRGRLIAVGAVTLFISLGIVATLVVGTTRGIRWVEHEPLWLVNSYVSASVWDAAGEMHLRELDRRISSGKLSRNDLRSIAATLLAYQANRSRAWSPAVGRTLEDLRGRGAISNDEWREYLLRGIDVRLLVRPVTAKGDPIAAAIGWRTDRLGPGGCSVDVLVDRAQIDSAVQANPIGIVEELPGKQGSILRLLANGAGTAGWHELTASVTIIATDSSGISAQRQVSLAERFQITSTGETLERIRRNPDVHADAIRLANGQVAVNVWIFSTGTADQAFECQLYWDTGERERLLGTCYGRGGSIGGTRATLTIDDLPAHLKEVQLVARPSQQQALHDVLVRSLEEVDALRISAPIRSGP